METQLTLNSEKFHLERYPKTEDKSLRAWSNAEILAFDFIANKKASIIHLFNDRFGIWNCALNHKKTYTIWTYASQKKAIINNLKKNNFSTNVNFVSPLEDLKNVELALLKIPKSLELFELFLYQIYKASTDKTEIVCCFMTKYFSASFLKIATKYFNEVEQTKAWKKARLLVLRRPKKGVNNISIINKIPWKNDSLQQYFGVFSSDRIDIGTQFLLENINLKTQESNILDVASGNGIITYELAKFKPLAQFNVLDDFNLAVASSKINLSNYNVSYFCDDNLEKLSNNNFDLVVSNPPFHFEHENNIEVSLQLFKQVKECLKQTGRFVLVANKHLNYSTHLELLFNYVLVKAKNDKFIIYECHF